MNIYISINDIFTLFISGYTPHRMYYICIKYKSVAACVAVRHLILSSTVVHYMVWYCMNGYHA